MKQAGHPAPVVVIGGCGFIGSNLADSLMSDGRYVRVVDNLSRPGVEQNLAWLRQRHPEKLTVDIVDIRGLEAVKAAVSGAEAVFHLAAQTAVTTSLGNPVEDFEINARGTLNVLEATRAAGAKIPVIFASTNKVYGALCELETGLLGQCHLPLDATLRSRGIDESWPLDFSTPYGCSKGVADQYVLDYAKSYDMRTAVLRMSCIYGPRQFGCEDQGWVAHFLIRALERQPITVFGDGAQVRDILHVSDAVAAYRALLANIDHVRGKAFNLGGGPRNAVSLNQVLSAIADLTGRRPDIRLAEPRTGDQRYFVADTGRLQEAVGWRAGTGWRQGLETLAKWIARGRGGDAVHQKFVA